MKQYAPFIVATIVVITLIVLGIIFIKPNRPTQNEAPIADNTPKQVTLRGEPTCLPHKQRNGPTTLECTFGLKTAANVFYALDMSEADGNANPTGRIEVDGLLMPKEALNDDFWQRYDIKGVVKVSTLVELEPNMAK